MAELVFKDLSFEDNKDKIKVNFLRLFYCYLEKDAVEKISPFEMNKNSITFKRLSENNARKKF